MGVEVTASITRVLPRHLLAQPQIRQALARRDFTPVFRAAQQAGLSFNALAQSAGIKAERVSKIARGIGGAITGIETVERIADGLHIPGEMLGLAARPWECEPRSVSAEEEPMHRRDLLRVPLAASGVALTTGIAAVLARTEQALAEPGDADVTSVEAAAESFSHGYAGRAPTAVLDDLVAEVDRALPQLSRQQSAASRKTLTHAIGQLGGLTAIVLHDLGRHRESASWFIAAAEAARRSGDRQLRAWILARRAMVPLNFGAPQAAARIAEQARHLAGPRNTAAAALAASVTARALALTGARDPAMDALKVADRIAGKLTAAHAADTWIGYCPEKHLVHRSQALTVLGKTGLARASQQAALKLTDPNSTMTRTLLLLDAAACEHRDGNSLAACEAATAALARSPGRYRDGLVRRRGIELHRSLPAGLRASRAGQKLADVLTP